jgi:hypothetical protein
MTPFLSESVSAYFSQTPTDLEIGHGIYEYDNDILASLLRLFCTVIASMLPMCSVIIQYFVQEELTKLLLIVIASAVFAFALALMTNARMIEIFAATSAYVNYDTTSEPADDY